MCFFWWCSVTNERHMQGRTVLHPLCCCCQICLSIRSVRQATSPPADLAHHLALVLTANFVSTLKGTAPTHATSVARDALATHSPYGLRHHKWMGGESEEAHSACQPLFCDTKLSTQHRKLTKLSHNLFSNGVHYRPLKLYIYNELNDQFK